MELTFNGKTYSITKNKKGEIWTNLHPTMKWHQPLDISIECARLAFNLVRLLRRRTYKNQYMIDDIASDYLSVFDKISVETDENGFCSREETISALEKAITFFKEFDFLPSLRFTNTLAKASRSSKQEAIDYVLNYFSLTGNQNTEIVNDKMQSDEFGKIIDTLSKSKYTQTVNSRLKIYEGPQGTGKTTKAIAESDFVTVCHSGMLPNDLMEDFDFVDGKAVFKPSAFQRAMTEDEGYTITLDEGNLLPFETLRFLQTLTDNKTSFVYKGKTINIKPNFKIIITMNLIVNGSVFALPEPLVDRAYAIKRFSLTAETLINAL